MFVCGNFTPFQCLHLEESRAKHFQWLKNKRIDNETFNYVKYVLLKDFWYHR